MEYDYFRILEIPSLTRNAKLAPSGNIIVDQKRSEVQSLLEIFLTEIIFFPMQAFIANVANFVQLRKNSNGDTPGNIPQRTKLSSISCVFLINI